MFKKGDKVLVEGVLSGEPIGNGGWRVRIEGGDAEYHLQGWVNKKVLRLWTDLPVHEVWRWVEAEDATWVVKSDGTVWEDVNGTEQIADSEYWTEVLAEYVRSNSR